MKGQLRRKDEEIGILIHLKMQSSDIIAGLKDTIMQMTQMLMSKDDKISELQARY